MKNKKSLAALMVVSLAIFTAFVVNARNTAPPPEAAQQAKTVLISKTDTQISPHKAIYNIKMISKKSGAAVINVDGKMFFEWRAVCDAWITDHRFNINYEYSDTPSIIVASDFSTYETMDGSSFDFNSSRKNGTKLIEEIRGSAILDQDTQSGLASFTIPEGLTFKLSPETFFPMKHTLHLIESAKAKQMFLNDVVFDGSDENGPVEINTFISGKYDALKDISASESIDSSLLQAEAYKIRMAFFPLSNSAEDADYEVDMVLNENGIVSHMVVEYRDFTIEQNLIALEKVEIPSCSE